MRPLRSLLAVSLGVCLVLPVTDTSAQPRLSQAECQSLRERLADHARLSEGVRRALASAAARYPAPAAQAVPAPAHTTPDRATRLAQIAQQRQQLDDQRLAAMMRFEFARALDLQKQIDTLDQEKAAVERQPPDPVPAPRAAPAPQPPRPALSEADRLPCEELPTALEAAKRIRRRELGAKEDQAAVIPLVPFKGQRQEQVARDIASQFSVWPEGGSQIGLLDQQGDGRVDAFVDNPGRDLYRLYRQRSDGTVAVEALGVPGPSGEPRYDEIALRLEEATWRQSGRTLADLLSIRPAGPIRVLSETADFAPAMGQFLAGNFAEASRVEGAAARSGEYQNLRGESIRQLEILTSGPNGLLMRRLAILPRPGGQELWEETAIVVRPTSYWRTDAEITVSREIRTTAGALVGSRTVSGPARLSLER